jgi:hypothetical protein
MQNQRATRDSRELQGGQERRREASRGRTRNEAGRVPAPVEARDDAEERASREPAGEGSAMEAAMARACAANSQVEKLAHTRRGDSNNCENWKSLLKSTNETKREPQRQDAN